MGEKLLQVEYSLEEIEQAIKVFLEGYAEVEHPKTN